MSAGKFDIVIEKGSTFSLTLIMKDKTTGTPIDLTNFSARMQVRANIDTSVKILDLSTTGGEITINGPIGEILILVSAANTTLIKECEGVYDLEIESPGNIVTRVIEGSASIVKEVTR